MTATAGQAGGVDRYFFNLLRCLPAANVHSQGLVVGDVSGVSGLKLTSFAADGTSMLQRWSGMRRSFPPATSHGELVVSHFAPYALPILDRVGKRPLVVHFHGPWALESRAEGASRWKVRLRHFLERAVYARASRFIVLSRAFADILHAQYKVPFADISIVPGGVDVARFAPAAGRDEARTQLGWPAQRPIVTTVRRLVPSKGIENLIAAVAAIRKSIPEILVHIVGTGPLAERVDRVIADAGLERNVRLVGRVPDDALPAVYRASNLLVVPSVALEGFGLVVVEALASGTPALVTPVGGLPEVVAPLDERLVLPGAEPSQLAAGIVRALSSGTVPDSAACMSYATRFDWATIAAKVGDVYRELV